MYCAILKYFLFIFIGLGMGMLLFNTDIFAQESLSISLCKNNRNDVSQKSSQMVWKRIENQLKWPFFLETVKEDRLKKWKKRGGICEYWQEVFLFSKKVYSLIFREISLFSTTLVKHFPEEKNIRSNQNISQPIVKIALVSDKIEPMVTTGSYHTCALSKKGEVWCWGRGDSGQLGDGRRINAQSKPVKVDGLSDVLQISSGLFHNCALEKGGTVKCWGLGNYNQLGIEGRNVSSTPVQVRDLSGVDSISSGSYHNCAVLEDGAVRCWGRDAGIFLNNEQQKNQAVPVLVPGLSSVKQVTGGEVHNCALLKNGTVQCWGEEDKEERRKLVKINLEGVAYIDAGDFHTCAVKKDHSGLARVFCWGKGAHYRLGYGGKIDQKEPIRVKRIRTAIQVSSGLAHNCALIQEDSEKFSYCWGWEDKEEGVLGSGRVEKQIFPEPMGNNIEVTQVSAGWHHTCVQGKDGGVSCTGNNEYGQLGNGKKGKGQKEWKMTVTCYFSNQERGAVCKEITFEK